VIAAPPTEVDEELTESPPLTVDPSSGEVPSAPTGLAAIPGNQSILLQWSSNPGSESVTEYILYMAESDWSTWSNDLPGATRHTALSCCAYLHSGLTKGRNYYFRVAAQNASGESVGSNLVQSTPGLIPIRRASLSNSGEEGDDTSYRPLASGNGRYISFQSDASNLVGGDSNGARDVFVRDLQEGTTTRVSTDSIGNQGDADSFSPWISRDGRSVVFWSDAVNLVQNDTNGVSDVFLHDLETGVTTRVSVDSSGNEAENTCSGGTTCGSFHPSISADGTHVSFRSYADNLVSGDTNGLRDIFVRDLTTGATTRASVSTSGVQGDGEPDISILSGDGRYVTFDSKATNLVQNDSNELTGGGKDIFIHDHQTGVTLRVSAAPSGGDALVLDISGNIIKGGTSERPSISADGRYIAYYSDANNLVSNDTNDAYDIFVYDMQTGQTTRVSLNTDGSEGNFGSFRPSVSGDGRFIVFSSDATNLVFNDNNGVSDIFVHDIQTGATARVSMDAEGNEANNTNFFPSISIDGRYIAFSSNATNFVVGDTNGATDVYVAPNPPDSPSKKSKNLLGPVRTG
jgi:Tol biopolymer transport system component